MLDLENQLGQPLDIPVIQTPDLRFDLLQQLLAQAALSPRIDIYARGREQRLLEICDRPPAVLLAVAQHLPMAGRDLQEAAAAPAVRAHRLGVRRVDALDALALGGVERLVFDQVVQHFGVVLERLVGYGYVAVGFPHGERRVCYVPFAL